VAGTSWFAANKKCVQCQAELKVGMNRHSCKACQYHLCAKCQSKLKAEWLLEMVSVTLYRAAQHGIEEDTFQVKIERGATIGTLKMQILRLYGLVPQIQVIQRDIEEAQLQDCEYLNCDDGDVLHLRVEAFGNFMLPQLGSFQGIFNAINDAVTEVTQMSQALQKSLENTAIKLKFVLLSHGVDLEKRCEVEVVAAAKVSEVLDMVKLELDAEDLALDLEYMGQVLPLTVPIHLVGLRDGDTVLVRRGGQNA